MKRLLALLFLPFLMSATSSDTVIQPKRDGGKVIIAPTTSDGTRTESVTVSPTSVGVVSGATLKADTITNAAGTGAVSASQGVVVPGGKGYDATSGALSIGANASTMTIGGASTAVSYRGGSGTAPSAGYVGYSVQSSLTTTSQASPVMQQRYPLAGCSLTVGTGLWLIMLQGNGYIYETTAATIAIEMTQTGGTFVAGRTAGPVSGMNPAALFYMVYNFNFTSVYAVPTSATFACSMYAGPELNGAATSPNSMAVLDGQIAAVKLN